MKEVSGMPQEKRIDKGLALVSLIVAGLLYGTLGTNQELSGNLSTQFKEASVPKLPENGVIFDRLANLVSGK